MPSIVINPYHNVGGDTEVVTREAQEDYTRVRVQLDDSDDTNYVDITVHERRPGVYRAEISGSDTLNITPRSGNVVDVDVEDRRR